MRARGLQNTKFYALLLFSVMIVGIFTLSPTFSSLMSSVVIKSTGKISTTGVTARSGSPEDIQDAVDAVAAAGGGTVYIPEGDFEFDIGPNKTYYGKAIGVLIPGGVNIIGQGKDKTILRQPRNPPLDSKMFYVDGQNGKPVRISGIKFAGHVVFNITIEWDDVVNNAAVHVLRVTDFRVDHCSFIDFASTAIGTDNRYEPYGINRGVIDHCDIDNPYKDIYGGKWAYGISVGGTGSWGRWEDIGHYLGKYDGVNDIVYIEDCNFSRTRHAVSSNMGGFYVTRHCKFTEPRPRNYGMIDVHGLAGYDGPGGRGLEAYDNEIVGVSVVSAAFWTRGGGGVINNNNITDCNEGVGLNKEGNITENWVHDLWIWGNSMNTGTLLVDHDDYTENVDYFLYARPNYTPYPYPHPLTLQGTP